MGILNELHSETLKEFLSMSNTNKIGVMDAADKHFLDPDYRYPSEEFTSLDHSSEASNDYSLASSSTKHYYDGRRISVSNYGRVMLFEYSCPNEILNTTELNAVSFTERYCSTSRRGKSKGCHESKKEYVVVDRKFKETLKIISKSLNNYYSECERRRLIMSSEDPDALLEFWLDEKEKPSWGIGFFDDGNISRHFGSDLIPSSDTLFKSAELGNGDAVILADEMSMGVLKNWLEETHYYPFESVYEWLEETEFGKHILDSDKAYSMVTKAVEDYQRDQMGRLTPHSVDLMSSHSNIDITLSILGDKEHIAYAGVKSFIEKLSSSELVILVENMTRFKNFEGHIVHTMTKLREFLIPNKKKIICACHENMSHVKPNPGQKETQHQFSRRKTVVEFSWLLIDFVKGKKKLEDYEYYENWG